MTKYEPDPQYIMVDPEEELNRDVVDFKWIINHQINLCRMWLGYSVNEQGIELMRSIVDTFEDLMTVYINREDKRQMYKTNIKAISAQVKKEISGLNKKQRVEKALYYEKYLARMKFRELIALASRNNLVDDMETIKLPPLAPPTPEEKVALGKMLDEQRARNK